MSFSSTNNTKKVKKLFQIFTILQATLNSCKLLTNHFCSLIRDWLVLAVGSEGSSAAFLGVSSWQLPSPMMFPTPRRASWDIDSTKLTRVWQTRTCLWSCRANFSQLRISGSFSRKFCLFWERHAKTNNNFTSRNMCKCFLVCDYFTISDNFMTHSWMTLILMTK